MINNLRDKGKLHLSNRSRTQRSEVKVPDEHSIRPPLSDDTTPELQGEVGEVSGV